MNTKQLTGMIGSVLLFIGVFMPIVHVPVIGTINYFHNGRGDGVIVLILALISVLLVLGQRYKGLWFTGIGSLGITLFTFINFQSKISRVKQEMTPELVGNPFHGLVNAAVESFELQWGWALLILGAMLVIASASMEDKTQITEEVIDRTERREQSGKTWIAVIILVLIVIVLYSVRTEDNKTAKLHDGRADLPSVHTRDNKSSKSYDRPTGIISYADSIGHAYVLCKALDNSGLLSKRCEVLGSSQSVNVTIDTPSGEAEEMCANIVARAMQMDMQFDTGWKVKIYSPHSNGNTIAECDLWVKRVNQ
jgi:uncharacterized membrane protein YidH (DUF202 family)